MIRPEWLMMAVRNDADDDEDSPQIDTDGVDDGFSSRNHHDGAV